MAVRQPVPTDAMAGQSSHSIGYHEHPANRSAVHDAGCARVTPVHDQPQTSATAFRCNSERQQHVRSAMDEHRGALCIHHCRQGRCAGVH